MSMEIDPRAVIELVAAFWFILLACLVQAYSFAYKMVFKVTPIVIAFALAMLNAKYLFG